MGRGFDHFHTHSTSPSLSFLLICYISLLNKSLGPQVNESRRAEQNCLLIMYWRAEKPIAAIRQRGIHVSGGTKKPAWEAKTIGSMCRTCMASYKVRMCGSVSAVCVGECAHVSPDAFALCVPTFHMGINLFKESIAHSFSFPSASRSIHLASSWPWHPSAEPDIIIQSAILRKIISYLCFPANKHVIPQSELSISLLHYPQPSATEPRVGIAVENDLSHFWVRSAR